MLSSLTKITFLSGADLIATFALWMLMVYLTNVWKLSITHAAGIINVFSGITIIMPLVCQFLVDAFMGNYWMILVSSFVLCSGLGFLTMSTPPVLAGATGTCSAYEPECIGEGQKILFYIALALIAIGTSGHTASIGSFAAEQISIPGMMEDLNTRAFVKFFLTHTVTILVPMVAIFGLPYVQPWSIRFGVPAICVLVATIFFLSGSRSYIYIKPQGSGLTTLFRVIVASASKIFYRHPGDASHLYEKIDDGNTFILPHSRGLRCLDKAAIILPNRSLQEQQNNRWRLCRVTEVEETKAFLRVTPLCLIFILLGVVSSIANTYFLEQANHMNHKLGHLTVPLPILLWIYMIAKGLYAKHFVKIANRLWGPDTTTFGPLVGILISVILGVLCCIVAAKVEARRLDVVRSHGLVDRPDQTVPMSMFWLIPQFLLLAGLDGLSEIGLSSSLGNPVPSSINQYRVLFVTASCGIGTIGSVLSVFLASKISGRGGNLSWFQDTLNKSRLDNYYWMLAVLGAINLVLFISIIVVGAFCGVKAEDVEAELEGTQLGE